MRRLGRSYWSKPAPGVTVSDFTGIDQSVIPIIDGICPDDMSTDELSDELVKRFDAAKIEPPLSKEAAHVFALELKIRARKRIALQGVA